jgi:hypothetical protein
MKSKGKENGENKREGERRRGRDQPVKKISAKKFPSY